MFHTKAQVSVEFLMLVILMVLIFSIYVPFLWRQQLEIEEENEYLVGEKIASSIKNEVETAVMFGSGYRRNFTLPEDIFGSDYTISIDNKILRIRWKNKGTEEYLIAHQISGSPKPGKNIILNQEGVIVFS